MAAMVGRVFFLCLLSSALGVRVEMQVHEGSHREAADGQPRGTRGPAEDFEGQGHPDLCDVAIVSTACANINWLTESYYGTAADADKSVIHAAELAEQLAASVQSVHDFLQEIGVANVEGNAAARDLGAFAVSCDELCRKTVASIASIPGGLVPNSSDVACYQKKGSPRPVCDIDVSDKGPLSRVQFTSHSGKLAAKQYGEVPRNGDSPGDSKAKLQALQDQNYWYVQPDDLRTSIANMFRIYPLLVHVDVSSFKTDSAPNVTSSIELGVQLQHNRSSSPWDTFSGDEIEGIEAVASSAQAYVATALRKLSGGRLPKTMTDWFGNNDRQTQRKARKVLNGISRLLMNVDYKYDEACDAETYAYVGADHWENLVGGYKIHLCDLFFEPSECDFACQLGTLVHEASHHKPMNTDDVCLDEETKSLWNLISPKDCENTAYGRDACLQLATRNDGQALKNADNIWFFTLNANS